MEELSQSNLYLTFSASPYHDALALTMHYFTGSQSMTQGQPTP